jgi:hypothetical protein
MVQFLLIVLATFIGASLAFLLGVYIFRLQKKKYATLTLLAEFQAIDVGKVHAVLEKHVKEWRRSRPRFVERIPTWACTYSELNSKLDDEERRILVPFIQFFERLVLLYESNFVDKRTLWSLLGRQITWWLDHFFTLVQPNDENNVYGNASRVAKIAEAHHMEPEPWFSLSPKIHQIPARPKDNTAP